MCENAGESEQPESTSPKSEAKVGGRKSLLKPDGTPYAPWMRVAEGSEKSAPRKSTSVDPLKQLSSIGLKTKYLGDELELSWKTGDETGNVGFLISRKAAREGSEFKLLADSSYAPAELLSKGKAGGAYSFLVAPEVAQEPGSWIYKLSDMDSTGKVSDLAQTLVEVEAAEDTKLRLVALAGLLAVLGIALFLGLSLDPLADTSF